MGKSRQTGKLSSDGILFPDIGNSRVGVGSTQPTASLDVNGSVSATSFSGSGSSLTGLTGASAATYGDENSTPVIVVDANGRITGISTVATAGAGSGGGISEISEDTTPQLGGNLDVNGKNINFGDSAAASDDRLNFGAGADLSIYHDGTNSYIDVVPDAQNSLYIRNNVANDFNGKIYIQAKSGENSIYCSDDAGVVLYYDAALKFQTTSTGFTVTGTGLGNWKANDSGTITAGTGDDFQIYHDGTSTYLDNDTGHIYIRNNVASDVNGDIYIQAKSGENSIYCADDSSVYLYSDNSLKLQTTSTGITVTGTGLGNWKANDSGTITAGTGNDFQIYHDGTDTYLDNDTGHLYIRNASANDNSNIYIQAVDGENSIICADDSSVYLYYDNALKLQTTSAGVTISGTLSVTTLAFADDQKMTFGASSDLQIYHNGTDNNSYIDNVTGHLYLRNASTNDNSNIYIQAVDGENSILCTDDSSVYLYYDNALKLQTTSTGFTVTGTGLGNWKANDSGTITAGTGDDLKIYHDGTNSYIDVVPDAMNHLYIRNNVTNDFNGNIYIQARADEHSIICNDDGSVALYYDNAWRLQTTSAGVTINGALSVTTLDFADSQKLRFGTGLDAEIYHDGTDTYFDNDTGQLYIRNNVAADVGSNIYIQARSGEHSIICNDDGSVALYYDNAYKLQTSSTGFTVNGTGLGNWKVNDNNYFTAGTSDDLQIYHYYDSVNEISASYIDNDTGHLYIRNNVDNDDGSNIYIQAKSGEHSIVCNDDGSVALYYDNAYKLQTTSAGVTINGALSVTTLDFADSQKLRFGTGLDAEIYHDGTNTYFDNDTGILYIRNNVAADVGGDIYIQAKSGENSIVCSDDAGVSLYYDAAWKLQTSSTGITVNGTGLGNWKVADNDYFTAGDGDDFQIYHNGTSTYLDNDTGHLYIRNASANDNSNIYIQAVDGENSIICQDDSSVQLYYDNNLKLATASGGINVTGTCEAGGLKVNDSAYITAGLGDDFQIYHDATSTYLDNDTGHIFIRNNVASDVNGDIYIQAKSGEHSIVCLDDSEVRLYYDGSLKLSTGATGVTVSGTLSATDVSIGGGHAVINSTGANITGVVTATSFVKSSNSGGFLKADGTEDTNTYNNYTDSDVDSHLNQSNPTSGYVLSWNGSDYAWVEQSGGGGGGSIGIQSGGTTISSSVSTINFVGVGLTVTDNSGTVSVNLPGTNRRIQRQVATASQTTFNITDGYRTGFIDVYLNGSKLDSTEYTATNGTQVVLTTGCSVDDVIETIVYVALDVTGGSVQSDTNPQLGGNLTLGGYDITGTGDINITGSVTATSFSGNGASLTNVTAATATSATTATTSTNVTVADESSDTTCFPLFVTAATGDLPPKSGSNLTFDSASGILGATTFQGNLDLAGLLREGVNISGKLSANTNIDVANGMVHLFTTTETTTSTPNIRYNSSTTLNSSMNAGEAITVVLISAAAAAGYSAQLTIDGSAITENWLGGSAPTAGGSSGFDVYTYNIIKTFSGFIVLANVVNFA